MLSNEQRFADLCNTFFNSDCPIEYKAMMKEALSYIELTTDQLASDSADMLTRVDIIQATLEEINLLAYEALEKIKAG